MKSAQNEIRTRTTLRMPPPQDGASTNFATWAFIAADKVDKQIYLPKIK